jgi:regulator of protease activity HflC (stomatin/prohibitin superfamily)
MGFGLFLAIALTLVAAVALYKGIRAVPQNDIWVIERFGKYRTILSGGLNLIMPFIDDVKYKWDMREQVVNVEAQAATTKDNIRVLIDGVLYFQVTDGRRAAYGHAAPVRAIIELAQTTMRAQIGRMDLDETLSNRSQINDTVVDEVNTAAAPWGLIVKRYEINDILPPEDIQEVMKSQAQAERKRREEETTALADRNARVTRASGMKEEAELLSQGERIKIENEAQGAATAIMMAAEANAKAVLLRAEAEAKALELIGNAAQSPTGQTAVAFELAKQAIGAHEAIAKKATIVFKESNGGESSIGNTVAEAIAVATVMGQTLS